MLVFLCVERKGSGDCEDAAFPWFTLYLPLIGFWMFFLQNLIRNILPGALEIWLFFIVVKQFFKKKRKKET